MRRFRSRLRDRRVVVLPDFFLDAITTLPTWSRFRASWDATIRNGGGNIPIGPVDFRAGGNATNLAIALARLGARVDLVTETNSLGMHLLREAARGIPLGLSHVVKGEVTSATLALEFGGANLMLSHAGPLYDFGPSRIPSRTWRAIETADAVAVTNWSQNRSGTRLLAAVAKRVQGNDAFLFLDTADPRHRGPDAKHLLSQKAFWARVDAWGLNENEALAFAPNAKDPIHAAQHLSQRLGCALDLHTRREAVHVAGAARARAPAYGARARRLTGAGDAWNAGNLAGYLLDLPAAQRLRLAHRVANAYVTGRDGRPPTGRQVGLG